MAIEIIRQLPTYDSSDEAWIGWYRDLRSSVGSDKAKRLFAMQWNNQDGYNSEANTTRLREKMKSFGVEIDTNTLGYVSDFGSKTFDFFGDYFTAGKWIGIGLMSVLAVSVGGLLIQIAFKKDVRKEAVDIGATIATRGMNKIGK